MKEEIRSGVAAGAAGESRLLPLGKAATLQAKQRNMDRGYQVIETRR
jgi:hypothetical protein